MAKVSAPRYTSEGGSSGSRLSTKPNRPHGGKGHGPLGTQKWQDRKSGRQRSGRSPVQWRVGEIVAVASGLLLPQRCHVTPCISESQRSMGCRGLFEDLKVVAPRP